MYAYEWDMTTGGYNLTPTIKPFDKDVRPVFFEELEFLRLDKNFGWQFPSVGLKVVVIFIAVNLSPKRRAAICLTCLR